MGKVNRLEVKEDNTRKMKILNLYAGIGGNRKLWGDEHEVTAVEIDPEVVAIYKKHFPNDTVIVGDAHEYLLKHFEEFDFIWSSPPCPTHSDIRRMGVDIGQVEAVYPDMQLYEEIILLKHFFKGQWIVENVIGYYEPLIKPQEKARHYFWSNFIIGDFKSQHQVIIKELKGSETVFGFNVKDYKGKQSKRKLLRNCVDPKLGQYILECAFKTKQETLNKRI